MKTRNLGAGVTPCVSWNGDLLQVAYQSDPRQPDSRLIEAIFTADLEPVGVPEQEALSASAAACPCYVTDTTGDVLLAFKDGAPDYPLKLKRWRDRPVLGLNVQGFVASRGEQLAWEEATGTHSWRVRSMRTLAHPAETIRASDDAEGIAYIKAGGWPLLDADGAHIREDGWPLLRYEHRFSSPFGTMPAIAGDVILCESLDLGLIGRWGDLPGWLSVLPGEYLSDPRAALSADGQRLAVTGWGPAPGGVWLAVLTQADLGLPHVAQVGRPCWVGSFKTVGFEAT